ncbi:MAG: cell wall-binding repeat-containing protein, partial [Microcella sp.]
MNAADFDPGFIISDDLFYTGSAMTESQIQQFLDQRIGNCENANCLNVYTQTTRNMPVTERCNGYAGAANERASRIIFKVQQSCNISAKVILVTLQKEQSLVTSRRPSASTLERAMGYYCPDDPNRPGWCHPDFAGFFNQVMNASAQFQRYRLQPNSFSHRVGTQQVRYHPNASCGSRTVTIKNAATAGLYNYTPYTPNQAAMNNLFGLGDSCSAYGNRNFWRIYSEWFGSPTGTVSPSATTTRLSGSDRYGTSVAISKDTYPNGAPAVYVAVGSSFPDGLAAAP